MEGFADPRFVKRHDSYVPERKTLPRDRGTKVPMCMMNRAKVVRYAMNPVPKRGLGRDG